MAIIDDCYPCRTGALPDPPLRERILTTRDWRVAHAFNSTVPGWLVLVPHRHIGAFADLTADEAAGLGPLVRRLSIALTSVTGCVKTYLMQFSEQEGFAHLHLHLVPRAVDQPAEATGPRVLSLLSQDPGDWLDEATRDAFADRLLAALPAEG